MRFHSLFFLFPLLALMTLAAPHDAHADITTGLVAHWTFDNTTSDASGQGNHGTAQGGPTYQTGKINQALSFDGIDDSVTDTATTNFPGTGSPYTMAAWVQPQNFSTSPEVFLMFGPQGTNQGPHLAVSNGRWRFGVWGGALVDWVTTPTTNWQHVVGVFDGTNGRLYVDGQLRAGPIPMSYTAAVTIPLRAGGATGGFNYHRVFCPDARKGIFQK